MRAALLARVSTGEQAAADRHSLPAQLAEMRARCEREGWEIVREYELAESAFTGDWLKRPGMAAVMRAAEAGEFEVLMVHELSRWARDEAFGHEALNRLMKAGVRLVNLSSNIDYSTAEGRMMFGNEQNVHAYWSRKMSEHIKKGMRDRFAKGLPVGDIPFGYRTSGPAEVPKVVAAEGEALRWAFEAYANGTGYQAIASEWNRRGLRPRSKRGLEAFGESSVQSIIENRFYAGFVSHKGEEKLGAHEPVITEAQWLRAANRTRRQTHGEAKYDALLLGLATCARCAGPVWTTAAGETPKGGRRRVYYREPARKRGRSCEISGRMWRVEDGDAVVTGLVRGMGLDGRWLEEAWEVARHAVGGVDIERERERLRAKRERLGLAMVEGMLSPDRVREEMRRLDRELAELPAATVGIEAGSRLQSMAEAWEEADAKERNEVCRVLFDRVWLDVEEWRVWVDPAEEFEGLFAHRADYVRTKGLGTPARTGGKLHPSAGVVFGEWELVA